MAQGQQPTILLIESDTALRWVIALGLRQQEMCVIDARTPLEVAERALPQPDLLIIDVDTGIRSNWSLIEVVRAHPPFANVPIVVLSWEHAPVHVPLASDKEHSLAAATQMVYLPKPFDARVLQATIQHLLNAQAAQEAARIAKAEEALLATYTATHAPASIWPVMTAAGLLLAFIGMLLNVFFIIVGLLIVVLSVLLWTLGTQSLPSSSLEGRLLS